jgi:hypothetical protein
VDIEASKVRVSLEDGKVTLYDRRLLRAQAGPNEAVGAPSVKESSTIVAIACIGS